MIARSWHTIAKWWCTNIVCWGNSYGERSTRFYINWFDDILLRRGRWNRPYAALILEQCVNIRYDCGFWALAQLLTHKERPRATCFMLEALPRNKTGKTKWCHRNCTVVSSPATHRKYYLFKIFKVYMFIEYCIYPKPERKRELHDSWVFRLMIPAAFHHSLFWVLVCCCGWCKS